MLVVNSVQTRSWIYLAAVPSLLSICHSVIIVPLIGVCWRRAICLCLCRLSLGSRGGQYVFVFADRPRYWAPQPIAPVNWSSRRIIGHLETGDLSHRFISFLMDGRAVAPSDNTSRVILTDLRLSRLIDIRYLAHLDLLALQLFVPIYGHTAY